LKENSPAIFFLMLLTQNQPKTAAPVFTSASANSSFANPTGLKSVFYGRRSLETRSATIQTRLAANPSRFRGNWAGILTQPGRTFNYEMNLRRAGGKRFVGTSVITFLDDPSIFGVMTLRGSVVNGSLLFKETQITDQNLPPNARWCYKGGRLKLSNSSNGTVLRGSWSDPGCNSGEVRLQKL
jgi:hypothetical protein